MGPYNPDNRYREWVPAFHLLSAAKNGMGSHEMGRALQVSHDSAWFLSHRLREAFAPNTSQPPLSGTVEMDEAYIGGRTQGRSGRPAVDGPKTPVVTIVERDGEARSRIMRGVTSKNFFEALKETTQAPVHLMTDSHQSYRSVTQRTWTRTTSSSTLRASCARHRAYEHGGGLL